MSAEMKNDFCIVLKKLSLSFTYLSISKSYILLNDCIIMFDPAPCAESEPHSS